MSLILVFHNDQTEPGPLREDAHYTVGVFIGDGGPQSRRIASGRVEGHKRSDGWKRLVQRFLEHDEEQS